MTSKQYLTRRFTGEEQLEVCRQIAHFVEPAEIVKYCREEFNKDVSKSQLSRYKNSPKWRPLIQRYRDAFSMEIAEIPLAHKIKRVEELCLLFKRCKNEDKYNEAKGMLEQIRVEVEGKRENSSPSQIFINQDFRKLTDEQLEEKRLESINIVSRLKKTIEVEPIEEEADGNIR